MAAKGFKKFSGCYTCRVCKRQTRENQDRDAASNGLCDQCWELGGMENEVFDGISTVEETRERAHKLMAEIKAKGGSVAQWTTWGDVA